MNIDAVINSRFYRASKDELVRMIIDAIKADPDERTDGECLDAIIAILRNDGYEVSFPWQR